MPFMRSAGASLSVPGKPSLPTSNGKSIVCCRRSAGRRLPASGKTRDVVALNVAAHRLENLIHDRRLVLASQHEGKPRAG
jgi:hypothetical protein